MEPAQVNNELNIAEFSHEGMSGKANEDSLGVFAWQIGGRQKLILGIVADGVGGQIAGEVASRLAVDTVKRYFDGLTQIENINNHLDQAIKAANKAVFEASQNNPDYRGMSTTIAITAIIDAHLYTAHVGDSRIYLLRNGRFRQISTDHTWAQEAIEAGLLTPEQAKKHPNRNVIRRHLGGAEDVEVDHRLVLEPGQSPVAARSNQGMIIREGDTLLICSDGLTDMIDDRAVLESLHNHYLDLGTASKELIDKANRAGGKDNITVVILQVPPKGPPPAIAVAPTPAAAVPEPTVVPSAAPAATVPVAAQPSKETGGRRGGVTLMVVGGIAVILLIAAVAVGAVLIGGMGGGDETPEGSTAPAAVPQDVTAETVAPATAAFLTTESEGLGTEPGSTPSAEAPGLIPTLKATPTNTPLPTVAPSATVSPTPEATESGSSSGGPPQPTNTSASPPEPGTTQEPSETDTPLPPPADTDTPVPPPPTNTPGIGNETPPAPGPTFGAGQE